MFDVTTINGEKILLVINDQDIDNFNALQVMWGQNNKAQAQETWGSKQPLMNATFGLKLQHEPEDRFLKLEGVFLE